MSASADSVGVVGVVGGGTMGVGIAYVFAMAGYEVTVVEPDAGRRSALTGVIADAAAQAVRRGKVTEAQAAAARGRLRPVTSSSELPARADAVIESVPERPDLKREVLVAVEAARPALLASNTSAISIDLLAGGLAQPERFLGMHFFNPVWSLPLVEVVRGARTSEAALTRACELVAAIGKESIVVRNVPGFATSRLDMSAALEAMRMLEEGVASAEDIDRAAVLAYRHPVGPLRLSDIVGLDVRLDIARTLATSHGARFEPPRILVDLVAAGHLGQKSGRGFHDWEPPVDTAGSGRSR